MPQLVARLEEADLAKGGGGTGKGGGGTAAALAAAPRAAPPVALTAASSAYCWVGEGTTHQQELDEQKRRREDEQKRRKEEYLQDKELFADHRIPGGGVKLSVEDVQELLRKHPANTDFGAALVRLRDAREAVVRRQEERAAEASLLESVGIPNGGANLSAANVARLPQLLQDRGGGSGTALGAALRRLNQNAAAAVWMAEMRAKRAELLASVNVHLVAGGRLSADEAQRRLDLEEQYAGTEIGDALARVRDAAEKKKQRRRERREERGSSHRAAVPRPPPSHNGAAPVD